MLETDFHNSIGETRSEALQLGLRFYRGACCAKGHADAIRYTSTRHCYDCQEELSIVRTRRIRKYDRLRKARQRARAKAARLQVSPLARIVALLLRLE